ncbi:hypothetical protein PR048_019055 [Dryococelus australis]|uniref:Uncharacterized protein n=1 Tax=Dryococelus australis TaxID=614101 RepID=A0ABQ9H2E4_9NEOP|nr:hypothetical protein PR048_019055 [Dryococelus australis]
MVATPVIFIAVEGSLHSGIFVANLFKTKVGRRLRQYPAAGFEVAKTKVTKHVYRKRVGYAMSMSAEASRGGAATLSAARAVAAISVLLTPAVTLHPTPHPLRREHTSGRSGPSWVRVGSASQQAGAQVKRRQGRDALPIALDRKGEEYGNNYSKRRRLHSTAIHCSRTNETTIKKTEVFRFSSVSIVDSHGRGQVQKLLGGTSRLTQFITPSTNVITSTLERLAPITLLNSASRNDSDFLVPVPSPDKGGPSVNVTSKTYPVWEWVRASTWRLKTGSSRLTYGNPDRVPGPPGWRLCAEIQAVDKIKEGDKTQNKLRRCIGQHWAEFAVLQVSATLLPLSHFTVLKTKSTGRGFQNYMTIKVIVNKLVNAACSLRNWPRDTHSQKYFVGACVDREICETGDVIPGQWRKGICELQNLEPYGDRKSAEIATRMKNNERVVPHEYVCGPGVALRFGAKPGSSLAGRQEERTVTRDSKEEPPICSGGKRCRGGGGGPSSPPHHMPAYIPANLNSEKESLPKIPHEQDILLLSICTRQQVKQSAALPSQLIGYSSGAEHKRDCKKRLRTMCSVKRGHKIP